MSQYKVIYNKNVTNVVRLNETWAVGGSPVSISCDALCARAPGTSLLSQCCCVCRATSFLTRPKTDNPISVVSGQKTRFCHQA